MNRIILLAISMLAFACYSTSSQAAITSLIITGATVSKSTGTTTVSGTIVCTKDDQVSIFTVLYQVSRTRFSQDNGLATPTCSGGTDTWTASSNLTFGTHIQPGGGVAVANGFDFVDGTAINPPGKKVEVRPVP
jgi:hypothetical protein